MHINTQKVVRIYHSMATYKPTSHCTQVLQHVGRSHSIPVPEMGISERDLRRGKKKDDQIYSCLLPCFPHKLAQFSISVGITDHFRLPPDERRKGTFSVVRRV